INSEGGRYDPHFKPAWNPDLFHSMNFISHLGVYRASMLKEIGGFRSGYEGSQDYDLALRFIERIPEEHLRPSPHILYHWRAVLGSAALDLGEKSYAADAGTKAIRSHFERVGKAVDVSPNQQNFRRVIYPLPTPAPLVSLIIGTRDRVELLR